MKKIDIGSVCKQVYNQNFERLQDCLHEGKMYTQYSFEKFQKDMMADGFIASLVTVRSKWIAMTASGYILEKEGIPSFIDVDRLKSKVDAMEAIA